MERALFREDHELFRQSFRKFIEREVLPNQPRWNQEHIVDRDAWLKAGEGGFLCPWLVPEYGGGGGDFLHSVVVIEELARAYESGFAMSLHQSLLRRKPRPSGRGGSLVAVILDRAFESKERGFRQKGRRAKTTRGH